MKLISLGVVGRPFGIKGEIKVKPHNPDTGFFDQAQSVWLRRGPDQEPASYRVVRSRRHQQFVLLTLAGIMDRNDVEGLRGFEVVAPESELPDLAEDEFYWHDLIGLTVEDLEGNPLGRVAAIETTAPALGGNDVLVVRQGDGELLVPLAEPAIVEVDVKNGRIKVDPALVL